MKRKKEARFAAKAEQEKAAAEAAAKEQKEQERKQREKEARKKREQQQKEAAAHVAKKQAEKEAAATEGTGAENERIRKLEKMMEEMMKERREDKEKMKELQQELESKGSTAGSQAAAAEEEQEEPKEEATGGTTPAAAAEEEEDPEKGSRGPTGEDNYVKGQGRGQEKGSWFAVYSFQGQRYQWKWCEGTKYWYYYDGPNAVWLRQSKDSKGKEKCEARAKQLDDYVPPPGAPATRRVTTREELRVPDKDGEVVRVTRQSDLANEMQMPRVLRMKHGVKSDDLGDPTIEGLYRMYHDPKCLPIIKKQAAGLLIGLNAYPDDKTNVESAGLIDPDAQQRALSPGLTSIAPTQEINPRYEGDLWKDCVEASSEDRPRRPMDTYDAKMSPDDNERRCCSKGTGSPAC